MSKDLREYDLLSLPDNALHMQTVTALITQKALAEKATIHHGEHRGERGDGVTFDDVIKTVTAIMGPEAWVVLDRDEGAGRAALILSHDTGVWLGGSYEKNPTMYANWQSTSPVVVEAIKTTLKKIVKRPKTQNKIYVVVSQGSGLSLQELGAAGEAFIPDNYEPETVDGYRHAVQDLRSQNPCGRIVIFDGPPRCGKTHAIRAMLRDVPKALFIMVPSAVVTQLAGPSFLPLLMANRRPGRPIVIVLEDADEAVGVRKADNVSAVSTILNLSEGIYGAMLDIRVVATTNKPIEDLDPAVIGPGRLCVQVSFPELTAAQARLVHERLVGAPAPTGTYRDNERHSLGAVYKAARPGSASKAMIKPKRAVGFSLAWNPPPGSPAADLGLVVGETIATDNGMPVVVRADGQLQAVEPEDDDDDYDSGAKAPWVDDDSDLIDEDPQD